MGQVNDSTTLRYWLNGKVAICFISILALIGTAIYLIAKYERNQNQQATNNTEEEEEDHDDQGWKPSLKCIHPLWLLIFRLFAFIVLLILLILHNVVHGSKVFFFYAVWTWTLNTIYFGIGSFMSTYGCYQHYHRDDGDRNIHIED